MQTDAREHLTGLQRITHQLREIVLSGRFPPEHKVPEETVAREFAVSRTLARLAMGALEREGLLSHEPRRGFRVRGFTIQDLAGAIEIRGELEAIAARLLAEKGLSDAAERRLTAPLKAAEEILCGTVFGVDERLRWTETNLNFHLNLIEAADNAALAAAFETVIRMPLVSPRAIVFDLTDPQFSRPQIERAHADHLRVLDAIRARKGQRAAEIIRDHSIRSGVNKRQSLERMRGDSHLVSVPGLALIRRSS